VILGNLLTVPVKESLLYVQPIFVQGSAANSIPQLQRVAVYYNNAVGYAPTLADAVNQVVKGVAPPPTGGQPSPQPPAGTATVQQLLQRADTAYKTAQAALRDGDLAAYQREINRMGDLVARALQQSGRGTGAAGDGATTTTTAPAPTTTTAP
jgi:uncharacterized membrane protein (UPF0182 family)